jgi:hypothetical protein
MAALRNAVPHPAWMDCLHFGLKPFGLILLDTIAIIKRYKVSIAADFLQDFQDNFVYTAAGYLDFIIDKSNNVAFLYLQAIDC